jgi:nucleoside-diphosphate-sugar epimerase
MILVTGGSGLVGAHTLLELINQSKGPIAAIYRNDESLRKSKHIFAFYGKEAFFNRIEWRQADILDIFSLDDAFKGVSTVIHSAGFVSFNPKDANKLKKINIEGTANVVNAAIDAGVKRLVHVSSISALGENKKSECITEKSNWEKSENTSNYSISKHYAENEAWRASAEGLEVLILNPSTIIGPGDWSAGSPALFRRINEGLNYYSSGSNGFVAIEDVVNLLIKLIDHPTINQRYIANGANLSFQELFTQIANGINKKPPTKKAKKWQGKIVQVLDSLKTNLNGKNPVLTKESLTAAFGNKCFDNSKSIEKLDYTYTSIEGAIKETAAIFLRDNRISR